MPQGTAVVRSMPNTPALVGQGMAAIAPGVAASDDDLAWAASILSAVGKVVTVAEPDIDREVVRRAGEFSVTRYADFVSLLD